MIRKVCLSAPVCPSVHSSTTAKMAFKCVKSIQNIKVTPHKLIFVLQIRWGVKLIVFSEIENWEEGIKTFCNQTQPDVSQLTIVSPL